MSISDSVHFGGWENSLNHKAASATIRIRGMAGFDKLVNFLGIPKITNPGELVKC
jgi:hypothetical protein